MPRKETHVNQSFEKKRKREYSKRHKENLQILDKLLNQKPTINYDKLLEFGKEQNKIRDRISANRNKSGQRSAPRMALPTIKIQKMVTRNP